MSWPLYKLYGHAFDAFKTMVQDDGAAIFKRLEEEKGPLPVLTPQVRAVIKVIMRYQGDRLYTRRAYA